MGYVYLIKDDENNTYKIGVTKSKASKRLKKLQTGNSTELTIEYLFETEWPFKLESMLHNRYKLSNVLNEWFFLTDEEVKEFPSICEMYNNNIKILKNNPFFGKNLK